MQFLVFLAVAIIAFGAYFVSRKSHMCTKGSAASFAPLVGVVALLLGIGSCLTVVPAGPVGVVDYCGTVSPNTLNAGINFVNPLANVHKFSVKRKNSKK
jgi:hypothetical protein